MAIRGERYETLRVIASGGMATVHLGRALGAGGFERLVAIKIMHPHLASEPSFVAMFLDEARLAARIRHPNVVSTLDVQADDEGAFLVMEYVEGPSLQQVFRALLKSGTKLPLDVLLRVLTDTLAGLHAAHELRDSADQPLHLVHRDVSPQNVLLGVDGIARITDFGVASAEARLSSTQSGQVKGKIGYMSPEQARAEAIDRRADIYAAGVILWEILSGGRRFRTGTEAAILTMVAEGDCPPLGVHNPDLAPALEECCMRALRSDPAERYATAADFSEALEVAAAASGVHLVSARGLASFVTALSAHAKPVDLPAPVSVRASLPGPLSSRDVRQSHLHDARPSVLHLASSSADAAASPGVAEAGHLAGRESVHASPARAGRAVSGAGQQGEAPHPPPSAPGADDPALVETRPERKGVPADVSPTSMSTANLVRQATLKPQAGASHRLYWGIAAALIFALLAATNAMRLRAGPQPDGGGRSSAADLPAAPQVAVTAPTAEVTAAPPSVEPSAPAASAAPSVAGEGAGATPRPSAVPEPRGAARKPDPAKRPGGDGQGSPVYRPPDL